MIKHLATITVAILAIGASPAFATVYNVNQNFTGTFTQNFTTSTNFTNNYSLNFSSLISGDASLFSNSLSTIANGLLDPITGNGLCSGICSIDETLKNGDHILGTFTFNSKFDSPTQVSYFGNTTITGGTGLFAGATGTGTFSGIDSYLNATSGNTSLHVINSITTLDVAAVPEPQTYAMLLAGLGLIGFSARRTNNDKV